MKRFRLSVVILAVLAVLALSGKNLVLVFVPTPELVVAQNSAEAAALAVIKMDYAGALELYRNALPILPGDRFHRRMQARALAHMGSWEEAAALLAVAAEDSTIRGAALADAERLRALEVGRRLLPAANGIWEKLVVTFEQDARLGAVAVLDDGRLVTAYPGSGSLAIWTTAGQQVLRVGGLGTPASLSVNGDEILVADMANNRVHWVNARNGAVRTMTLGETVAYGVRAVCAGASKTLWVADHGGGRVLRTDYSGRALAVFGGGTLDGPTALLADGDELLVAESGKDRVIRFDRNGRMLRTYVHPHLKEPVALAAAPGGFIIQSRNGLIFWARTASDDVVGPLPTATSVLQTGSLGIAVDLEGNLWWGDGLGLRMARRLPEDRPEHLVEILRVEERRGAGSAGTLTVTVSVMDKSGRALETLQKPQFRLICGGRRLVPIAVENLSEELPGRRIFVAMEASDALNTHRETVQDILGFWLRALTPEDRTAVMDIRDTFTLVRNFTASRDLVTRSLVMDRSRIAAIDLKPAAALEHAILTLAPTDFARAVLWVTSGEGLDESQALILRRMAIINQVPIFILHVGERQQEILEKLAVRTNGRYFRIYDNRTAIDLPASLAALRSGRYRVAADIPLPGPEQRGRWFNVTLEAMSLDAVAYDRTGYYSF